MNKATQDNALFNNNTTTTKSELDGGNKHFLTDENFKQLKQLQNEIYTFYEVSPSIRKLVNLLITEENLENIKAQFNTQFSIK